LENKSEKILIGHKLKRLRLDLSITQLEMANEIGISPSYLNLLESNQRPVTVQLLFKLGQVYNIDLKEFADDESGKIAIELSEIFADPLLSSVKISKREIRQLASASPSIANSISTLYSAYTKVRETLQSDNLSENLKITTSPLLNVREFLEKSGNHFPLLETAADNCRKEANVDNSTIFSDLTTFLLNKYNIKTEIIPQPTMGNVLRKNDPHRNRLLLSEILREPQRVFQVSIQIALIAYDKVIEKIIEESLMKDLETIQLLRITLAGYFAGSLMMPYSRFKDSATQCRHDIDILARRFSSSFEQVCHRLTTLNRKSERGIPFFFLRVDEAGHISKRLSAAGLQFARQGGSCGRWIPHQAFRTPGKILAQNSELEEGQRFFTIARTVSQPRTSDSIIGTPLFSVALGCEIKHAENIVYADGLALGKSIPVVPIGLSCKTCERNNCQHRGEPPLGREIKFDPNLRYAGLFEFSN